MIKISREREIVERDSSQKAQERVFTLESSKSYHMIACSTYPTSLPLEGVQKSVCLKTGWHETKERHIIPLTPPLVFLVPTYLRCDDEHKESIAPST